MSIVVENDYEMITENEYKPIVLVTDYEKGSMYPILLPHCKTTQEALNNGNKLKEHLEKNYASINEIHKALMNNSL